MNYKNPHVIYGTIIASLIVIVGSSVFFTNQTEAKPEYPEKVKQLGVWIDEKSATYDEKVKVVTDLQKQIDLATKDKNVAEQTNKGFRYALCTEYKLKRVNGQFVSATDEDCVSFQ